MDISQVENLCFEGGGVKGIAFLGCIDFLQKRGTLSQIKRVIGSSVGVLPAVLIACRSSSEEAEKILDNKDFNDLKDDSWGYVADVFRVVYHYGMCRGDALFDWFGEILEKLVGNKDITFLELFNKTSIELVMTGTNLNKCREEYFSYQTQPNMPVRLGARISTAIPVYFKAVQYGQDGDTYIDGGTLNNFPIWYSENLYRERKGSGSFEDASHSVPEHIKTLGFKLMSTEEHIVENQLEFDKQEITNIKQYCSALASCICRQIERSYIHGDYWKRVVPIDTGTIYATDFGLDDKGKEWLKLQGYQACEKHILPRT